jgi:uncharacterized protein YecT (DUF1311 family)
METVFESPDGTFELQQVMGQSDDEDQKFFVVSKANPNEKRLLTSEPSLWVGNVWYSSPDSKWLATTVKEVHEVGRMELFRRIEGIQFDKIKDFSPHAWASLSKKRKYTKGEEGIIDFVNWSPDSARLLISLRGPVHGDADDKPWFIDWSIYFNLQTEQFEYTTYLNWWDPQVFQSASADDYDTRMQSAPVSAEPLTDTVSEEEWKRRLTEADRALNETYRQALAKLNPEEAARLRSAEITWIKTRDKVTEIFAKQGTPPNPILRRLQSQVDATKARAAELKQEYLNQDEG